jgi:branched-chain amino acid transport system substrate-binding protein
MIATRLAGVGTQQGGSMRSARRMVAAVAVLGLGLGLVACGGDDDDDDAGTDTTAAATTAAGSTDADAGADAGADTTEAGGTETTAAGGDDAADADATSGEVPVNEAAAAVECPDSENGVTDTEILLGGSAPLSGPVAAYASVPKGAEAYFDWINEQNGGITSADGKTRKVTFKYLDDQYSPPKTLENVRLLVEQDGVWAILNAVGTPSNTAIRDYMNSQEVPQLLLGSGAATWGRDIADYPWTIGYQADYETEGKAYATYALEQNPDAKIGILHANDDFGKDYVTGIKEGLGDKVDQIVAEVTYETTDATIDSQVSQVKDAGADVFMLIATPQFAIQGIKRVNALGWEPVKILTSVSSSVAAVIEPAGKDVATGWISDTYIKDSTDPQFADDPAIADYKEILAAYDSGANPDDGFYLYGMSVAQTFERLVQSLPQVCRASVMAAVKDFEWADPPLLYPGVEIKTGPDDGFPVQQVQLMEWNGEIWDKSAFPELIDASSD